MPGSPGNTNALRHGLYARHFPKTAGALVEQMRADSLIPEIAAARVLAAACLREFLKCKDTDRKIKLANSTTNALIAIGTLITRQHLIGSGDQLDDFLQRAIADPFYLTEIMDDPLKFSNF